MKKSGLFLILFLLSSVFAQSVQEILDRVEKNLSTPWQAVLKGQILGPDGRPQEFLARLYALPQEEIFRIEFVKPGSLADNFTVLTKKEVWNYLYLTNQLIKSPRERAQIQGLGFAPAELGNPSALAEKLDLRLIGEVSTPQGLAYRLRGIPKEAGAGFREMEIYVLKPDPRPVRFLIRDEKGVVADLEVWEFKRTPLDKAALLRYPKDAQVVRR